MYYRYVYCMSGYFAKFMCILKYFIACIISNNFNTSKRQETGS